MTYEIQTDPSDHPALRISFGFITLNLVYFLYVLLFPIWLGLSQAIVEPLQNIVSATAPITSTQVYTLAADLTLAIGTCFLILFTGIAIFLGISAVQKDQTGRYTAIAEAFMILTIVAITIFAFSIPDKFVIASDNSYAANALNTPEFTAMSLVVKLAPAIMLFVSLIYVIRHSSSGAQVYEG